MKDPDRVQAYCLCALLSTIAFLMIVVLGLLLVATGAWWFACMAGACAIFAFWLIVQDLRDAWRWR